MSPDRFTGAPPCAAEDVPLVFDELLERAGFRVERIARHAFTLRFSDATAMLAHAFMRLAFLPPWVQILPPEDREGVFTELERRLNARAARAGALALTVPFACYDCRRVRADSA